MVCDAVRAPPIKMQGIKTKLVPFIREKMEWSGQGRWIEPFVGTGSVLFNIAPKRALVGDTNRHVIRFYEGISSGEVDLESVRSFLEREGALLLEQGQEHYYRVRDRFNEFWDPFDFLFLNRACFNGLMRFNQKGRFNTPFCRKSRRYSQAYITKICNQVDWVSQRMRGRDWTFVCADWKDILSDVDDEDFVYVDPPYEGRYADYYNSWTQGDAEALESSLKRLPCPFIYSMWLENRYRRNERLCRSFSEYRIEPFQHFYHLGSTEDLRNSMTEALVLG